MSLFGRQRRDLFGIAGAQDLIPPRPSVNIGMASVNNDTALRHSAVWACLRLRADLISTLPVDCFTRPPGPNKPQIEVTKPPILVDPGGDRVDWCEWMYSSQVDLDRSGNAFGLITEVNSLGLPNRIDLQPVGEVTVIAKYGQQGPDQLTYRISGKTYPAAQVWHEKQFTVAGFPMGLSPVAYAAWTIGEYLSIQQFATDWFSSGATPIGHLKNTQRQLPDQVISAVKDKYKAAVKNRDLFVSGADWEYSPISATNAGSDWIEDKKLSAVDIARFFGCPATEIEAAIAGSSVTYANLSQDDLRFLIKHLGPALTRREKKISRWWLPQPRYIKFNVDALLRMDPAGRANYYAVMIDKRVRTPDECRELENLQPLTEAQYQQFERLFPPRHPVSDAEAQGDNPASTASVTPEATPVAAAPTPTREALHVEAVVGRPFERYNPDQPREPNGEFGESDGGSSDSGPSGPYGDLNYADNGDPLFSQSYQDKYGEVTSSAGIGQSKISVVESTKGPAVHIADDSKGTDNRQVLQEFTKTQAGQAGDAVWQAYSDGGTHAGGGITASGPGGSGDVAVTWSSGSTTVFGGENKDDGAFELQETLTSSGTQTRSMKVGRVRVALSRR